jgi:tetratricopeptide (TPR) repeat protein
MHQAHRHRALTALAVLAVAAVAVWWAISPPRRALVLPAEAALLRDLAAEARDAPDLRRRLAARGIGSIRAEAPCDPAPAWNARASDVYLDLWRRYTRPGGDRKVRTAGVEFPLARGRGRIRILGLDEPPGLAEVTHPGDALLAKGRTREALAAWEKALEEAPGLPGLWARVADADRRLGDLTGAERALGRALTHSGPNAELYDRLAAVYSAMKRPDLAATALEMAAGLDEAGAARWIKAARALEAAGQRARAADCVRRALDREPGNAGAKTLLEKFGGGGK